jgi:hypothetical protein
VTTDPLDLLLLDADLIDLGLPPLLTEEERAALWRLRWAGRVDDD